MGECRREITFLVRYSKETNCPTASHLVKSSISNGWIRRDHTLSHRLETQYISSKNLICNPRVSPLAEGAVRGWELMLAQWLSWYRRARRISCRLRLKFLKQRMAPVSCRSVSRTRNRTRAICLQTDRRSERPTQCTHRSIACKKRRKGIASMNISYIATGRTAYPSSGIACSRKASDIGTL